MATRVPNTTTFKLTDVTSVITSATGRLSSVIANSTDSFFDPAYKGSKDSLLDFRNYTVLMFGYLYNFYALANIAASGWHVPTDAEYLTMMTFLGGQAVAGGKLKSTDSLFWNTNVGATNSAKFNGKGGGIRTNSGNFLFLKDYGWHYAADANSPSDTYMVIYASSVSASRHTSGYLQYGWSVRLVKNSTTLTDGQSGTYVGNDGKIYPTICIGTQEWLADNLRETLYNNLIAIPTVTSAGTWAALVTGAKCAYNNDENNV